MSFLRFLYIIYFDTGSTKGKITKVTMDGCDSDSFDYCPAVKGTNATGTIEITTNATISQMACSMSAFGLPVGIPCPVKDGCNSITNGAQCPIAPETKITYQIKIFIAAVYPEVRENFFRFCRCIRPIAT